MEVILAKLMLQMAQFCEKQLVKCKNNMNGFSSNYLELARVHNVHSGVNLYFVFSNPMLDAE